MAENKVSAMEKTLTATTAIPVGVSAMKVFGITVSDWIVIMTLVLLMLQLMVWGVKAVKTLHSALQNLRGGKASE